MLINLKVEVRREDGPNVSADEVANALEVEVEGMTFDVEDSTYEVVSAEAVAERKESFGGDVLEALRLLAETFREEHPLIIDDTMRASERELTRTERVVEHLMYLPSFGEVLRRAEMARLRKDKRSDKRLSEAVKKRRQKQ